MKNKIIKYLSILILIICFVFVFLKINNHNETFDINVKKVEKLESSLYDLVTLYDYNESVGQYVLNYKYFKKEFVINEIFKYYNNDLIYAIESYKLEDDNLIIELNNLKNIENEIYTFKLMKLTLKSININNFSIKHNNNIIEI